MEKDRVTFQPLMEVRKEWLIDGEYLRKLSKELKERGFPDFIIDENGKDPELVIILVAKEAFDQIVDVCKGSILQQVCWKREGEYF
jgi:hypothetical protein